MFILTLAESLKYTVKHHIKYHNIQPIREITTWILSPRIPPPRENLKTGTNPYALLLTLSDQRGGVLTLTDPQRATSWDFLYGGNIQVLSPGAVSDYLFKYAL